MKEKDKPEGAPLARVPLTDGEIDTLSEEIRRVLAGSCSIKNLADNATAALVHPDTMGVAFKAFGYAPSLLAEVRAARAWRKEAEALIREAADWTGRPGLAAKLYAFLEGNAPKAP